MTQKLHCILKLITIACLQPHGFMDAQSAAVEPGSDFLHRNLHSYTFALLKIINIGFA